MLCAPYHSTVLYHLLGSVTCSRTNNNNNKKKRNIVFGLMECELFETAQNMRIFHWKMCSGLDAATSRPPLPQWIANYNIVSYMTKGNCIVLVRITDVKFMWTKRFFWIRSQRQFSNLNTHTYTEKKNVANWIGRRFYGMCLCTYRTFPAVKCTYIYLFLYIREWINEELVSLNIALIAT